MWESKQEEHDLIEVQLTPEEQEEARAWGENLGSLRNSITSGRHNYFGRLGEIAVAKFVGGTIQDDYEYDVLSRTGQRLEVKTKVTTVVPRMHYECSVCQHNAQQMADAFVFVRVSSTEPVAWICGMKSCEQFFKEATYHKKGDIDPRNNYTFHASCFNMEIRDLDPVV